MYFFSPSYPLCFGRRRCNQNRLENLPRVQRVVIGHLFIKRPVPLMCRVCISEKAREGLYFCVLHIGWRSYSDLGRNSVVHRGCRSDYLGVGADVRCRWPRSTGRTLWWSRLLLLTEFNSDEGLCSFNYVFINFGSIIFRSPPRNNNKGLCSILLFRLLLNFL